MNGPPGGGYEESVSHLGKNLSKPAGDWRQAELASNTRNLKIDTRTVQVIPPAHTHNQI